MQSTIQAGSADADPYPDLRDCLGVGSSVRHSPVGAFRHPLRANLWEVRPSWFPVRSQGRVLHLASLPAQASSPYTFTFCFCDENRLSCHRRLGALGAGIGKGRGRNENLTSGSVTEATLRRKVSGGRPKKTKQVSIKIPAAPLVRSWMRDCTDMKKI